MTICLVLFVLASVAFAGAMVDAIWEVWFDNDTGPRF